MKLSLTKFTPTEREFDQGNIRENDIFTAPSRFYRYTEEKLTQFVSNHNVSKAVSELEFALKWTLHSHIPL